MTSSCNPGYPARSLNWASPFTVNGTFYDTDAMVTVSYVGVAARFVWLPLIDSNTLDYSGATCDKKVGQVSTSLNHMTVDYLYFNAKPTTVGLTDYAFDAADPTAGNLTNIKVFVEFFNLQRPRAGNSPTLNVYLVLIGEEQIVHRMIDGYQATVRTYRPPPSPLQSPQ